jgi:hypothetical protein
MKNTGMPKQQKKLRNGHDNKAEQFVQDPNEAERLRLENIILLNEKLEKELSQIQEDKRIMRQLNTDLENRTRAIQEEEKKLAWRRAQLCEREKIFEVEKSSIKEVMEKMSEIALKLNQDSTNLEIKKQKFNEKKRLYKLERESKEPNQDTEKKKIVDEIVEVVEPIRRNSQPHENDHEKDPNVEEIVVNLKNTKLDKHCQGSEEVSEDTFTPKEMMPGGVDWRRKLEDFCARNGKSLPIFKTVQNKTNQKWSCKVVTYKSEYAAGAEFSYRRQAIQVSSQVAYQKLELWEEISGKDNNNATTPSPKPAIPFKNGSKYQKETWAPKVINENNNNENNNPEHNHKNNKNNNNNNTYNNNNNYNNNNGNDHNLFQHNINSSKFDCYPQNAKFFVIKSYTHLDVINSIKYSIWTSTDGGNRKLDKAFREFHGKGPIYLFYSITSSRQFCGVAEMTSKLDYSQKASCWTTDKYSGQFNVSWKFIKNLGNKHFEKFKLENNENKPVFFSRDTQEVPYHQGCEILEVFRDTPFKSSLLD